jgi:hypothetical protein
VQLPRNGSEDIILTPGQVNQLTGGVVKSNRVRYRDPSRNKESELVAEYLR